MSEVIDFWIKEINLPLSNPLKTSKGSSEELNNVLFGFEVSDGLVGVGEAAPSVFTGETQETNKATLKEIGKRIIDKDPNNYREIIKSMRDRFSSQFSALTALEISLFDYLSKNHSISLSKLFGGGTKEVSTDITVPISSVEQNKELVNYYLKNGFDVFKVKIGKEPKKDLDRLKEIYEEIREFGKEPRVRLDANQGLTPKQTITFLKKLNENGIVPELIEQPVPKNDFLGLKEVKERIDVPVAADESLFGPRDALLLIKEDAVDVFNIKLMESGILGALDIISIAETGFVDLMIGCMAETQIAIKTAASLVKGTNEFKYIDLDSHKFLEKNLKEVEGTPKIDLNEIEGHGVKKKDLELN